MSDTIKDSEFKQQIKHGESPADYAAVIRPKRAKRLIIDGVGEFELDNPTHTNDAKLIKAAKANGNLIVIGDAPEKADGKSTPKK